MAASNNQPSVVGEGFELSTGGYVERRYKSCADDRTAGANNTDKTGDQCWVTDNATLSLGGNSVELIQDNGDPNRFHPRSDDGSRVERGRGAVNGDDDGEWWVVTNPSGTQYWFGRNQLPGWSSGKPTTGSVWTEPVFGNHASDPCHQATFAASACTQAWRWNLDYVVDPHGNTMSLWYSSEQNFYAKNLVTTAPAQYTRAGQLDRVEYGTRVDPDPTSGVDTVFAGLAAERVAFGYGDRCLSGCGSHDDRHFPDTPFDLDCASASCNNSSPTFWTTRRLATVTTQVRNTGANDFRNVERWTLTHGFPDPGDTTRAGLWLDKISHTGLVGAETSVPDVVFTGAPLNNRVDAVDNAPAMNWQRLVGIRTETGGLIQVDYSDPDCVAHTRVPAAPETNTLRCYPVKWTPEGFTKAQTDYFHKYVVDNVTESDLTGGAPRVVYHYTYSGDPAWHFADDDGLLPDEAKTWNQWRGYAKVTTTVGDPGEQTATEALYLRGMNGDHLPSGTRSVTVTDSQGGAVVDEDWLAGMVREQRTLNGPGGAEVSGVVNDPWASAASATRTINGVTVASRFVETRATHGRTARDGGRPALRTTTSKTFDNYGMAVKVDDTGDESVTGDEQCSTTTYEPRNTTAWLVSYPHRAQSFGVSCAAVEAGSVGDADVIGDGRSTYDGHAWGVAPTKGDVTAAEQLSAWNNGSPSYLTVSRSAYDVHGRVVESWDVQNNHSQTTFTPAVGGPVIQTVDTNPRGWTTTTNLDPAWGLATSTIDLNGLRSDIDYDGLGRFNAGWGPGRVKGVDTPDLKAAYAIRTDGAVAVSSQRLNPAGNTITTYALYDGLLRPRQTQAVSPSGGRILTDTFYDTAGRAVRGYGTYYATGDPGPDLVAPADATTVPRQSRTVFDGAGRPTASITQPYGVERWRTTTAYGGDHTDVTPPAGGTPTSTWTDGRGHTTQLRQYQGSTPTGPYDAISYHYNNKNLLDRVTDPGGNSWVYGFDVRGRQTSVDDPDKGHTTLAYNDAGQLTSSTDSRGITLAYTYDNLGRKTNLYRDSTTGTRLANWTYDTAVLPDGRAAKGQPASAVRFSGSTTYTVATTVYDVRYRPTSSSVTIPVAEGALAGTYSFTSAYYPDGSPAGVIYPKIGDLDFEATTIRYNDLGLPQRLTNNYGSTPEASYVSDTRYNALAEPEQYTLYQGLNSGIGSRVYQAYTRELETGRLSQVTTLRDSVTPNTVSDIHYTYDNVGKVTKASDTPAGGTADHQCFTYDNQQRLTEAWTPANGDCAAPQSKTGLGGPAPYWQSWTFDPQGRRKTQTDHAPGTGTDATTSYTYPTSTTQPHTLSTATRTVGGMSATVGYTYDSAGNTLTRPAPGGNQQTLTWDVEGHLANTTDPAGNTSYLYDANGNRLIRRDAKGKTLYLPGNELRWDSATGVKSCTRFYDFGGGPIAQRTAAGVTWLTPDYHGTQQLAIDANTQVVTQRRELPFGTPRDPTPVTWVNEKGFVGGTIDPTGLTHLGAREYDPGIGRFVSVDPVMEMTDPQQLDGYSYAGNAPTAASDPSGLCRDDPGTPCGDGHVHDGNGVDGTAAAARWCSNLVCGAAGDNSHPAGGSGGNSGSGGGGKAKPKKCSGWDVSCRAKQAWTSTVNWVDDHKAAIAGFVVGTAVGLGCGVLIGWTGVGAVACGALAGAVGSAVEYAVATEVEHKGDFSWGGLLKNAAIGAVTGAVMGGVGSVLGAGLKAGAAALGSGIRAAAREAGQAAAAEARNIGTGLIRGGASKAAGAAAGRTGAGGCNSFAAGSSVLMADGTTKPIDKVQPSDRVLATDPETGKTKPEPVTATIAGTGDKILVTITVHGEGNGAGGGALVATSNHPIWVPDLKRWVPAGRLQVGQWLQTSAGTWIQVTAITTRTEAARVYNLTVSDLHTYYVLASTTPVLTHNTGSTCPTSFPSFDPKKTAAHAGGDFFLSGYANEVPSGFQRVPLSEVLKVSNNIGNARVPSVFDNAAGDGAYYLSHAEVQAAVGRPGQMIDVTRAICDKCWDFMTALGRNGGHGPVMVRDPSGLYIFGK